MASKFDYTKLIWEELSEDKLREKLKAEILYTQDYLKEHNHTDIGKYLVFVIVYLPENMSRRIKSDREKWKDFKWIS